jgi:hypothetical protein
MKPYHRRLHGLFILLLSCCAISQTGSVHSDFWVASDALGRKTPTFSEAGPRRPGKYIAMFYWTWHCDGMADFTPVLNITEILHNWPEAASDAAHPAWQGIWGGIFWWDEPLFGYYRTTDEWVLRKHAEMLADAGVDAVFFDCTNGAFTWASSYKKLLSVWQQARTDGVKTPQIAFLLPFSEGTDTRSSLQELYRDLYQPGLYKDLWFMWKGKPVIMAYPESLRPVKCETAGMRFTAPDSFSAIEVQCPSWSNNVGSLTWALYKWNTSYARTLLSPALAKKTFENFQDNARLTLSFAARPPGDYLWVLDDAAETVGVYKYASSQGPSVSYFNSLAVSGNYVSWILYLNRSDYLPLASGVNVAAIQIKPGISAALMDEIKNFFTFRPGQPDYVNGPARNDQWGWLENYPQHGYVPSAGGYEQVTVGVGQNARDASAGHCYAFNAPGSYGRSYTHSKGQNPRADAYLYGLNFMEQWQRAFVLDPELVFITGWNEWIAGRHENWPPADPYKPFAFPDEYDRERSRDLEPVKSWGEYGDVYYCQLVSQIRKFKGMEKQEPASGFRTVRIGSCTDWSGVRPEYRHYRGNTLPRNHAGQGDRLTYVHNSGRNDIVLALVARDQAYVYFYVQCAAPLSPPTDRNWMRLFIDTDRNKATGWQGYDLIVNRISPGDSAVIERSERDWHWDKVGSAAFAVCDNALEMRIPRSFFAPADRQLNFEFKWHDNMQAEGDIMDFYLSGDAAPGGRFNFLYQALDTLATSAGRNHDPVLPSSLVVQQSCPNPFNQTTVLTFALPEKRTVRINVFNVQGNPVRRLATAELPAGSHRVAWDGCDDAGSRMATGLYFIRVLAGERCGVVKSALVQ